MTLGSLIAWVLLSQPPVPGQENRPLEGHWEGLMVRAGSELLVAFDFQRAAADYRGSFTARSLRAIHIPLRGVRQESNRVYFELPGDFTTTFFEGELFQDTLRGTFREEGAEGTFSLKAAPPLSTPYRTEEVQFRNGNVSLSATLLLPSAPGPHPAVIFLHGAGAEGRFGSRFLADHFARRGVAGLIYDKRGVGASTGDWRKATFFDLADDALAGLRLLTEHPGIDAQKIGLYGHSQGGTIAPLIASRSPGVAFVISAASAALPMHEVEVYSLISQVRSRGFTGDDLANASDYSRLLVQVARTGRGYEELDAAVEKWRNAPWFSFLEPPPKDNWFWPFYRGIADYDAATYWARVSVPVLLMYAESDVFVPTSLCVPKADQALRRANNRDYTIVVFPGAPHTFFVTAEPGKEFHWPFETPGYTDLLTAWLLYRVGKAGPGH